MKNYGVLKLSFIEKLMVKFVHAKFVKIEV